MARGIFISYQRQDQFRASGFNLMKHSKYVNADFRSRHLITPVNSRNPSYIRKCVRDQMKGTSVTVVLIGEKTHQSNWVAWEIQESIERGNGVVAMRLKDQASPLPASSDVARGLREAGAEILDWNPHGIGDAVERAFRASGRAGAIRRAADRHAHSGAGSTSGGAPVGSGRSCG